MATKIVGVVGKIRYLEFHVDPRAKPGRQRVVGLEPGRSGETRAHVPVYGTGFREGATGADQEQHGRDQARF